MTSDEALVIGNEKTYFVFIANICLGRILSEAGRKIKELKYVSKL